MMTGCCNSKWEKLQQRPFSAGRKYNGFAGWRPALSFTGSGEQWEAMREQLFAAAASLTCALPRTPAAPDGYTGTARSGLHVLGHPGASGKQRKEVERAVLDVQKAFVATKVKLVKEK